MKIVLTSNPTFTPSTSTLAFSGIPNFQNNRLMVVVNQTTNTIIYAEGQSGLGGTWDRNGRTLTLNLNTNTGAYASTDLLQVIYDTPSLATLPTEEYFDPVNKARTSQPQSLIDTDFEYGLQTTKWEFVQLANNRPTVFYDATTPILLSGLSGTGTRTVSGQGGMQTGVGIVAGMPIYVQDSLDTNANGYYLVDSTNSAISGFSYTAKASVANASIFDSSKTQANSGFYFSGAGIPILSITSVGTTTTVVTQSAHNLAAGNQIYIAGTTATTNPPNGAWVINSTSNAKTFTFVTTNTPTGTVTVNNANTTLFARPAGFSIHRAYDGGVQFTAGAGAAGGSPNVQHIRQTRKYFRYQSGKGIQFSTGTLLKPSFNVDQLTSSGTTVTVNTKTPHGLTPGCTVSVSGATQSGYNGIFTVVAVLSDLVFTYTAASAPASSPATGFPISVNLSNWYGSAVRVGMFDNQNGVFFEFDGQTLYAVRRSSTAQIAGNAYVTNAANTITGVNTRFVDQLTVGDYIVLKGCSYKVTNIASQTNLSISPEFRGPTLAPPAATVISKTIDLKIPQSAWNIDKFNGIGPSGYILDLTKMQMLYIDYSWYGAGFIRWGMRGADGNVVYCHKLINNNVNNEAYMRSGNLPARYEVNTLQPITNITQTFSNVATVLNVTDTSLFPSAGSFRIIDNGDAGSIEYVSYTGKTATTFTGLTRGVAGGAAASTFTYSATAPIVVELASMSADPLVGPPDAVVSHWGSSVIMDGRFDDDLSFAFNAGNNTGTSFSTIGQTFALMSLRLAPSVDGGRTGALGVREIVNRMQLKLRAMDVLTNVATSVWRINLILNGRVSVAKPWQSAGGSSLAQIAYYTNDAAVVTGGESVYSFFFPAGGSANSLSQDLSQIREMGTSILGGGAGANVSTATTDVFPDGPDAVHITATLIAGSTGSIFSRLSWSEAQA
jgi:hypothetical protein